MTYAWYDVIGNFGVAMILLAYGLLQAERVSNRALSYHILNLVGAALILVSLCFAFNLSSFIIELAWMAISLYGLYKYFKHWRRGTL